MPNKYNRIEDRYFWEFKNKNLPDCYIVDIDGSLALFGTENPYNRDYSKDVVNKALVRIINAIMD